MYAKDRKCILKIRRFLSVLVFCSLAKTQNKIKGAWRPRGGKGDASLLYTMAATGSFA